MAFRFLSPTAFARTFGTAFGVALWIAFALLAGEVRGQTSVRWWNSSEDGRASLSPLPDLSFGDPGRHPGRAIRIDAAVTFQRVLGLGSSLEHSTCHNLMRLTPERRERVLASLVDPEHGIGMNLMRICIGTPDFTASPWYTYHDLEPGEIDPEGKRFSIDKDREYVLPVLKQAMRLNPRLRFIASPWSPPAWMKVGGRLTGGRIDPRRFADLATYFVRFIRAYEAEGIPIHAITVQNEPEYAPDTYPTCRWTAAEQRDFIRDHLGPAFRDQGIRARIWCFDHNFNHPQFPAAILADPEAARFVDGSAFHLYEGKPSAMSWLQKRFPDKHLYFTEGSTYGAKGAAEIISYFRNGSRSYNAWVTLIDRHGQPNPGPHDCDPTCIVLDPDMGEVEVRFDYYMYGQFMKFIRPEAVRIDSTSGSRVPPNVAFRQPDGSLILVAANPGPRTRPLVVEWQNRRFSADLGPNSVATFTWNP